MATKFKPNPWYKSLIAQYSTISVTKPPSWVYPVTEHVCIDIFLSYKLGLVSVAPRGGTKSNPQPFLLSRGCNDATSYTAKRVITSHVLMYILDQIST
jgi:hypothetical protein